MSTTIAIVGANLAGGRAAQALRHAGFDGVIELIGAEPHPPYERPPLSKAVLVGTAEPESAYLQDEDAWEAEGIRLRLGTPVTRIDGASRELELADGRRLRADRILLCTGGRVRRLGLPGEDLDGVHYLRTMEDALAIRERLVPGCCVVVIGGGFIGAEVASSALGAGCRATIVELEAVPLARVLGARIGEIITQRHVRHGVHVLTRTTVERIAGDATVTHVVTSDGARLDADLVVIGVGLEPAVELAQGLGIETDNGIVVDEFCETSVPGVFAAGDVANHPNAIIGRRVRLEHWQNAQNQAAAAARSLIGDRAAFREVPWFWSDQFDMHVQMAGHPSPDDALVFRGDRESESFSAFFLRDGALRAALSVNRPRDVRSAMRLIEDQRAVEPAQLADESADLRRIGAAPAA